MLQETVEDHRAVVGQRCHNLTKQLYIQWIFLIIENPFSLSIETSTSLPSKVNPSEGINCLCDTASPCEPALTLPGQCSAMTSARVCFSPTSTAAHQLRTDRCQDHCGSSVLLPLSLPFSLPVYQFSLIWETCCHIWALQREKRREGRDNTRQRWVEGSSGRREQLSHNRSRARTHTDMICHRPKHQCGCCEDDAP